MELLLSAARLHGSKPGTKQLRELTTLKSLDFLTEEVTAVRLQQQNILDLVERVKALQIQSTKKDKRVTHLESRVADLKHYARMNAVIKS